MNDREILLRAICACPEDDAPRLAYADWLDENGDPGQAEFIRLQIHLARRPPDRTLHSHIVRELQLWRELKNWRYLLGDWLQMALANFERGFNTVWDGTAQDIIREQTTFWRFGPVHHVRFSVHSKIAQSAEAGRLFANCAPLRNFRWVRIDGRGLTDDWVESLLTSPHLGGWRRLSLLSAQLTDKACELLAASHLAQRGCVFRVISPQITALGRQCIFPAAD